MPRIKKQIMELLASLSPAEIAKLVEPKLETLRREKDAVAKRLQEIERQLAALAMPVVRKVKRAVRRGPGRPRLGRPPLAAKAPKPVVRRRRRGGATVASKMEALLEAAGKPLRLSEICKTLVARGAENKKSLMNYVSRILHTNASFTKVGRGLYRAASSAPAPVAKSVGRKKAAAAADKKA